MSRRQCTGHFLPPNNNKSAVNVFAKKLAYHQRGTASLTSAGPHAAYCTSPGHRRASRFDTTSPISA
ncbi:uncharacterized protein L969DRAFT_50767 [Mixia osmundae IAM 14324]|uniref:Uncharacterized protein n=1 Tax=Mixia osmundae (strain CBS 9802 / IAM 14324 / JCM 22182 / KY 12970) TaxID=764103 RepID=G7E0G6_MIXOS|nr:uncharacterized protein L969DRAFT_50767 [Mixia osmundae IAM 14324]KEI38335.1 hypothetical protein L969DRAFT_50767 [Mixia osmundae IAM 14324]GAA96326.1 hypothetical protein E5Q_02992 [Mixia osmundae IAM 14324]